MHVGVYDFLRSESESELDNQLSGILSEANKQTNMHTCVSVFVYVCGTRANQRHNRHHRKSSVCECSLHVRARANVCWFCFANLSTVSVCLLVHTVTQKHTHTQTHKQHYKHRQIHVKSRQQINTCTQAQYLST
jgi:hypothetical protein